MQVRDAQLSILGRDAEAAAEKEAKFYADMRAQRKLEQESRFYKKDKSQVGCVLMGNHFSLAAHV